MIKLESHYSGDNNWNDFVKLFEEFWEDNEAQCKLLVKLDNHLDLAKVINMSYGTNLEKLERKIPALDGLTILECLKSPTLINRLREMLMRMPR